MRFLLPGRWRCDRLSPPALPDPRVIVETEGDYAGQLMAIGLPICKGRRSELAHLPILTEKP